MNLCLVNIESPNECENGYKDKSIKILINMSKLITYDKKIKKIIEENHDGIFYQNDELIKTIVDIINKIKKDDNTDHSTLTNSIIYFVYYSDKNDKYYLNYKRRQTKKKEYHETILNNLLKDTNTNVDQVGVFEVNKEVSDNNQSDGNEDKEPTSEELALLEKEIFHKNEINVIIDTIDVDEVQNKLYSYPLDKTFKANKKYYYEPYGTQWVHDSNQVDDTITEREIKLSQQFDVLRAIILPEQRSAAWFEMRDGKITASDGGTVIDVNPHEQQYKFILKKTVGLPFVSNEYVYHGKKLEDIAILIYEYRMNVKCEAFGLIGHPKYKFLGASPDSICGKYKFDGIHKSKYIGRMLEIKCPFVRKIKTEGPIIDYICPIYYWVQVQLQLECCDLEECDFWQCEIREYGSREEFINDTHPTEPFRSKESCYEKGCLIQLLPRKRMQDVLDGKYNNVMWDEAMFIYPPKIEMSPYDCDLWVAKNISEIPYKDEYKDYFFDKVIYWKLVKSKCVLINRDRKWFADNLPTFEKMWNYVSFFRKNKDKLDLFVKYIESLPIKKNKLIMNVAEKLYNINDPDYNKIIKNINDDINSVKEVKNNNDDDGYMFIDSKEPKAMPFKPKIDKNTVKNDDGDKDDEYMFVEPKKKTDVKPKIINVNLKKNIIKPKANQNDDYLFI
ncbi:YqaJ-like viral recombinase domain [Indivirus ILV1]|uniref:YqaJ-like viral recombinase domain n=1 Tax=Indivirus ILV1 TaxID=1977633 RepID=A0A1V0SDR6_9VIRU|nr:YqaJ-like viral recombinase domain [Indivirus ILV1]